MAVNLKGPPGITFSVATVSHQIPSAQFTCSRLLAIHPCYFPALLVVYPCHFPANDQAIVGSVQEPPLEHGTMLATLLPEDDAFPPSASHLEVRPRNVSAEMFQLL